jgi:hypothetical protein
MPIKMNILLLASELPLPSEFPVCLREYQGSTLLEYICKKTLPQANSCYTFVFHRDVIDRYHLDNSARSLISDAVITSIPGNSMGSACTALYGACQLNQEAPLLIVSTNEIVDVDYEKVILHFVESNSDAGVMTFESIHPRYSYIKLSEGVITQFAQQNPISSIATTGSFWFKRTADFINAAKQSILKHTVTSSQYYLAPVLNQLILVGKKISHYSVDGCYIPMKTDQYLKKIVDKKEG